MSTNTLKTEGAFPQPHTEAETPFAALPTPTEADVLRARLLDADRAALVLTQERDQLAAKNAKLIEHRDYLESRLRELETNPFTFALSRMDSGQVLTEAGQELQKLAAIVRRREAKGTFSLKIALKPFKGDALDFASEIKITEPKGEPAHAIFYASDDGALSRNDPRQKEFGFRDDDADGFERRTPAPR